MIIPMYIIYSKRTLNKQTKTNYKPTQHKHYGQPFHRHPHHCIIIIIIHSRLRDSFIAIRQAIAAPRELPFTDTE